MEPKKRHAVIFWFLYICVGPFLRWWLRYRRTVMKPPRGAAFVVANHTTDLDPALVGMSFPKPMVYVASEHAARFGFASRILQFAFVLIIRVKGKTDSKAGRQMLRLLRKGHNVCVFAEGNRSFNGLTRPIFPATGKLAKASGATLITYRITGGYFAAPRWGGKMRRGPIAGAPVRVYSPEELAAMSAGEVNAAIQRDIGEDAYARQLENPRPYKSKAAAQNIETALYLCPACGGIGTLHSADNRFGCVCGLAGHIDGYGMLSGAGFTFTTVRDWDIWQSREMEAVIRRHSGGEAPLFADENRQLCRVVPAESSTPVATGRLELFPDRLCCAGHVFLLDEMSDLAIIGRQTLIFSTTVGAVYEIKGDTPYSALKYQRAYEVLTKEEPEKNGIVPTRV